MEDELKHLKKQSAILKRTIRRLEFVRDYVLTGRYDRALKCRKSARNNIRNHPIIDSSQWKALRDKVILYYGAICMKCSNTRLINVDHIKPKSKYPELAFCFDNLQVLCWKCNKEKSNKDETDYRVMA
jgi:5-methylcytosine-specific restriction endonuclease McrA